MLPKSQKQHCSQPFSPCSSFFCASPVIISSLLSARTFNSIQGIPSNINVFIFTQIVSINLVKSTRFNVISLQDFYDVTFVCHLIACIL